MMFVSLGFAAFAQDCPAEVPLATVMVQLDAIDGLIASDRADDLVELVADTRKKFLCVDHVVPTSAVARFGHQMAVAKYYEQDEEEAVRWALAADVAIPGYPWPATIDAAHPVRELLTTAAEPTFSTVTTLQLAPPKDAALFMNGRWIGKPEGATSVPSLVQVFEKSGKRAEAWWQDGASFPEGILGEGEPPKRPGWAPVEEDLAVALVDGEKRYGTLRTAAAGGCAPVDAAEFGRRVDAADTALDTDDLDAFGAVYKKLRTDVRCLTHPVSRADLARFLVDLAIVENATGQAWEEPLATALIAHPAVDRSRAPSDIQTWRAPGATAPAGARLPGNATYYLDGAAITTVPDLAGVHVVQRQKDGVWQSRWLRNQPFPAEWGVAATTAATPSSPSEGLQQPPTVVALVAGFGRAGQDADVSGGYLPTGGVAGLALALVSTGHRPVGPVAAFWDLGVGLGPSLAADAYAGVSLGDGLAVDLGGGVSTVSLVIADKRRWFVVPQVHVGAGFGLPMGPGLLDLGVAVGGSQAGAHARLRAGLASAEGLGWYAGIELADDVAWFVQDGVKRQISGSGLHAGARIGLRL